MVKIFFIFICIVSIFRVLEVSALENIEYKKLLAPSLILVQSEEYTALEYKQQEIKRYKNSEFNTDQVVDKTTGKLLCEITDIREAAAIRAEKNIGKAYLRACLARKVQSLGSRYILFSGPDFISLYDKDLKKFIHKISSAPLKMRISKTQGIVILASQPATYCDRAVVHYLEGKVRTLLDDCSYEDQGRHIRIDSFVAKKDTVTISYQVYELVGDEYVLSSKKYSVNIKLS